MKLLIYGSNGWIGQQFISKLEEMKIEYVKSKVRVNLQNELEVNDEIIESKCTHVISILGRTHGVIKCDNGDEQSIKTIDYLEKKGKLYENLNDNLYSPLILSIICHNLDIHFTYIGTGCIYNGNNILDDDIPNFSGSSYSTVKSFTDKLIRNFNALNLRIRMPISSIPNERNFITKIVNYKNICSITNSMTVLDDFIPIFIDMMSKNITGSFNCTNPDPINHNEVLQLYKEIVDEKKEWTNFTIDEQNLVILAERSNNILCTKKLEEMYNYNIPSTTESLRNVLTKYKMLMLD